MPPLSFRFTDGSSQWWFALQVLDHGSRLQGAEAAPATAEPAPGASASPTRRPSPRPRPRVAAGESPDDAASAADCSGGA